MKKLAIIAMFMSALSLGGCVDRNEAIAYASRAHPECGNYRSLSHNHSEGGSQTEIQMVCGKVTRSITVKCQFGWGLFSDTTCHENN